MSTRDRPIRGSAGHPPLSELEHTLSELACETGYSQATCRAVWRLVGTQARDYLQEPGSPLIHGTLLPRCVITRIIDEEWVTCLEDLIERRLLLALEPRLLRKTIEELAELFVLQRGSSTPMQAIVDQAMCRLATFYHRRDFEGRYVNCASHGRQGIGLVCSHVAHAIDGGNPSASSGATILTMVVRMPGVSPATRS